MFSLLRASLNSVVIFLVFPSPEFLTADHADIRGFQDDTGHGIRDTRWAELQVASFKLQVEGPFFASSAPLCGQLLSACICVIRGKLLLFSSPCLQRATRASGK